MWAKIRKWLFGEPNEKTTRVKNFDDAVSGIQDHTYERRGIESIKTDKIVGSVGRAEELDNNFRYRKRAKSERYYSIQERSREGRPSAPIKVVRVKRDRQQSEYYVIDGHHRVADAKKNRYDEMNAEITDVVESKGSDEHDETNAL